MILELDVHEAREVLRAIQLYQTQFRTQLMPDGIMVLKRVERRLNPLYEAEVKKRKTESVLVVPQ